MTLNVLYALYCTKLASFGARHRNLNEYKPNTHTIGAKNVGPSDSTFWQYKVYADIRGVYW